MPDSANLHFLMFDATILVFVETQVEARTNLTTNWKKTARCISVATRSTKHLDVKMPTELLSQLTELQTVA